MSYRYTHWVVAIAWLAVAVGMWLVAVPAKMTVASFWFVNAAALAVGAVVVSSVRSARPVQSIAQVLYDAEHPTNEAP